MPQARCLVRFLRMAPRKVRLIADLVRGRKVNDALQALEFSPRAAARPVEKAIRSALANLLQGEAGREINPDEAVVKTIFIDQGPTLKRFIPRAMGRATVIRKRTSHLTVWVAGEKAKAAAEGRAKEKKRRARKAAK
ncbi:MAG: 50S ribosomal protein L22 [bacterium]